MHQHPDTSRAKTSMALEKSVEIDPKSFPPILSLPD
jgi:hypothetical protein